ncbi:MAG: glutathione peroxidase [Thiohalophilus sp.]|uniref:glutathione peroxidase n=1 Tax=Thiohalophilus sp. TaxID=3028392 RepID=UPI00287069A0|nr:glutathione peroxidase [Thiohalophilus sp.]MDR9435929.1 glutathione peroxidase [Thiohalophilus sp.]
MKAWLSLLLLACLPLPVSAGECPAALDFRPRSLNDQRTIHLCEHYRNKVVLIVNTASKCAFTPQYEGLETLYTRYRSQGLVVLGFPSNDFAHQEPGSEAEIRTFCRLTYGVQFPMFAKTRVREPHADPLYAWLGQAAGEFPQWNFHKYLLDRQGRLVASYPAQVRPDAPALVERIEALLDE